MTALVLTSEFAYSQNSIKRPDTYNYNRGLEELRNENYDDALIYLNKEVENDPKNGYAYSWIAMIRHTQEEYGRALTSADLALKNLPKKDSEFIAATYNNRAGVYLALEDTIKALNDYASAIKACPTDDNAYEKRAQIYYEQKNYELADNDYKQIIRLDQGGVMGYMGIGRNRNAQKQWDEAIEQFNFVANMYNDYSSAYSFRAEAYIGKEKWAEATDDIIKALSINGDNKAFALMQDIKEPAFGMLKAKMKIQGTKNPNNAYWPYCIGVMHEHNEEYEMYQRVVYCKKRTRYFENIIDETTSKDLLKTVREKSHVFKKIQNIENEEYMMSKILDSSKYISNTIADIEDKSIFEIINETNKEIDELKKTFPNMNTKDIKYVSNIYRNHSSGKINMIERDKKMADFRKYF